MLSQAQQVELTKAMAKSVESAFKQVSDGMMAQMRQQTANDNEPPSTRRSKKGASASAGMEANRRLTSSVKNLNKHVGEVAGSFMNLNKHTGKYNNELERAVELFRDVNHQLVFTQRKHRKLQDVMSQDVKAITERMELEKDRVKAEKDYTEHLAEMKKAAKEFTDQLRTPVPGGGGTNNNNNNNNGPGNKPNNPFDKVDVIGEVRSKITGTLVGLASLVKGVSGTFSDFQYAMQTSSKFTLGAVADSVQMGMSVRELMEMQSEFRADAMKTAGGLQAWTDNLKNSQMDLITYTGSLKEANKVNAQLRNTYMKLGFTLNEVTDMLGTTNKGMLQNFTKMSAITGRTISEIAKVVETVTGTDANRELLLKMTKDQRKDFVKNQTALVTRYTILTGSMERAQNLIEQQNRNRNRTAIDAMKESIRMRAAGGMVGMDSDRMERFQELNNAAPGSLNQGELEELASIRGDMMRRINELRSSGNMNDRMFADQIVAKLDLGDNNVFDKGLDVRMDEAAIAEQQAGNMAKLMNDVTGGKEMLATLNSIESILNQSLTPIAVALMMLAGQGLSRFAPGLDLLDGWNNRGEERGTDRNGEKKTRFKRTRTALLGREMLMQSQAAASNWGKAGRLLAKGGAPTALVAQGASMALDHVWTPETSDGTKAKEMTMDTIDTASAALMGATIGSFIAPGVGTAIGAALGGVVGAAYAFSNDDYFKTVTELEAGRHANEARKHDTEMKLVQAEYEYRKNNLDAFREAAGPGFESKMQELLDKHNAGLDASQQISLDGFAKYEDLRATLSETLNDEELKRMDEMYRDEQGKLAQRHTKQMENMRQIHNLNLQQTDAYKQVMKLEGTMKALEDFDTNGMFSADDVDAADLKAALGQESVEDSAAVLRDIAKNSGALTADEFNRLASTGTFAQMVNDMNTNDSFDFDDIEDASAQAAMRKLFESMESGGEGNDYYKKRLQTRLDQQNAVVADLDAQVTQRQADTVNGSQVTGNMSETKLGDLTRFLADELSADQLKGMNASSAEELVSRLQQGDEFHSPELAQALLKFNNPELIAPSYINTNRREDPRTYGKDFTLQDEDDVGDFASYLTNQGVSDSMLNQMGATGIGDLMQQIRSGDEITNQKLLQAISGYEHGVGVEWMDNARRNEEEQRKKAQQQERQRIAAEAEQSRIALEQMAQNYNTPQPETTVEPVSTSVAANIQAESKKQLEQSLGVAQKAIDTATATPTIAPVDVATIETPEPVGSDLQAKAATVGNNDDMYARVQAIRAEQDKKKNEAADKAVADGEITLAEVLEQLRLIHAGNEMRAQQMFDMYKRVEDNDQRRHLENSMFGEKRMQDMRAGKAGS